MLLWTIQTEDAWRTLNQRGYLRCRRRDADRDFLPAYDWMAAQMATRIGRAAHARSVPLWAWYQYDNEQRKRPDLRNSHLLPRGTRGYRIEFTLPNGKALLSDFVLWHYVLNFWYLPSSERDMEDFESQNGPGAGSWSTPLTNRRIDSAIRLSWERIFDLDWFDDGELIATRRSSKRIQATFWQLDLTHVTIAESFIAR